MNLGILPVDTFKLGATQVDKIMLGADEVWSASATIPDLVYSLDPLPDRSLNIKALFDDDLSDFRGGPDLTAGIPVTYQPGQWVSSVSVPPEGYIDIGTTAYTDSGVRYGICSLHFKPTTLTGVIISSLQFIPSPGIGSDEVYGSELELTATGFIRRYGGGGYSSPSTEEFSAAVNIGEWNHLFCEIGYSTISSIYINGVKVSDGDIYQGGSSGDRPFYVGGPLSTDWDDRSPCFDGEIDQLELYNTVQDSGTFDEGDVLLLMAQSSVPVS